MLSDVVSYFYLYRDFYSLSLLAVVTLTLYDDCITVRFLFVCAALFVLSLTHPLLFFWFVFLLGFGG